ncbi:leukocyte cysteine proteinase inhibitor 1-like [Patiria miniata]|uniref:Cystatin domain-containing protein n=1 Tax=Patiria miniata TaxID=46514 RepID=A0A914BQW9_PATMI|nr:leukocyte cysteine proteinase inhibitor 1-like [Patiria miniata]XP_038078432.1 leukocyte cysteine proteinase inhibitor 1-like [Patiria miniata]
MANTKGTPGGWSDPMPATPKIQGYADAVKPQVQEALGKDFAVYKAVLYIEQVVAGMNYKIKINVGGTNFIHVLLFVSLQGLVEFNQAWGGLKEDDPLEPPK